MYGRSVIGGFSLQAHASKITQRFTIRQALPRPHARESYIDSLGPFADVVISLLASIAKIERQKISERTIAGLQRAVKEGETLGRPKVEAKDPKLAAKVGRLRAQGQSIRAIAEAVGKSPNTVQRLMKAAAGTD